MNILVVGGAGYIGSHCVRQLIAAGHCPIVLDNLSTGHRESVPNGVPFVVADLGNEPAVTQVLLEWRIDVVMHFAALCSVADSVMDPLSYYLNNVSSTLRLLSAMRSCGVRRFVFSSTCAIYGDRGRQGLHDDPIHEDDPKSPINPYGQTKLDIENALRAIAFRTGNLSFACFRYFNAAGATEDGSIGEHHDPETHLIPLAIATAMGRRPAIQLYGTDYGTPDGTCMRDYVHVDDIARAHVAVLPLLAPTAVGLFYNLGTGRPTSNLEVIDSVERLTGKAVPVLQQPRRHGDADMLYADPSRARRELGWVPRYQHIDQIVASALRWHTLHPNGFAPNAPTHDTQ